LNALAVTITVYALVLAAVLGWHAVTGKQRGPRAIAAVVLVQAAAMLLVVVDAVDR
jgi:hypothetical protein